MVTKIPADDNFSQAQDSDTSIRASPITSPENYTHYDINRLGYL